MKTSLLALAAATLIAAPALRAQNQTSGSDDRYEWSGRIPEGAWIKVYNLSGSIQVTAADGDEVEVHAVKRWKRGDPKDVRFEMVRDGDDVTICALWSARASCDEDGAHYRGSDDDHNDNENTDVEVSFTLGLPKGVNVKVATINGAVDVRGATARVNAATVNGQIDAMSTSGMVNATTVNGDIDVQMQSSRGDGDLKFTTVNGSVRVLAPSNLSADLSMTTVMGNVNSDFPLTIQGRMSPRRIKAALNGGGRQLTLSTVNGNIELRKGSR